MIKNFFERMQNIAFLAPATGQTPTAYDPTVNTYLADIEKVASQIIENAKSANPLADAFPTIDIEYGSAIEKTIIKMASNYVFDPTAAQAWAQVDPALLTLIYQTWEAKQYEQTYRRNEIRKIMLDGTPAESFSEKLVTALSEGEGDYDFMQTRALFHTVNLFTNYTTLNGNRVPANMRGVLYMIRDMYKHLIATNSDSTKGNAYRTRCLPENVVIVIPDKLLNLIDVKELADLFHVEQAQILGKIVSYSVDDLASTEWYKVTVCDKNAIIRGRQTYEFTQDASGRGNFVNFFLTTNRMYAVCPLFKGVQQDFATAATAELAIIAPVAGD